MRVPRDRKTARVRTENDVDRTFEVLANATRRSVVEKLSEGGPASVDELAEHVEAYHGSPSEAELALVHRHIPKLRDSDVVSYDPVDRRVELDDAGEVLAVLGVVSDRLE